MFDRAATIFTTAALMWAIGAPARAQEVDFDHVIAVAGSQAAASQFMAGEALLVALDIDRDARLESLRFSQDLFDRTLAGLRDGDGILGLPAASTPRIAGDLDTAGIHWQSTKAALQDGFATGVITADQIAVIAADSVELMTVFQGVAAQYAEVAARNRLTSMLANALLESIHGTMLSQRMTTEFLLIVYGHEVPSSRASLGSAIVQFDQILSNLVNGNLERRLLPPPNEEIRGQLLRAQRVWEDEFRPIIRRALDSGQPTSSAAAELVEANGNLLEQMKAITTMYVGL